MTRIISSSPSIRSTELSQEVDHPMVKVVTSLSTVKGSERIPCQVACSIIPNTSQFLSTLPRSDAQCHNLRKEMRILEMLTLRSQPTESLGTTSKEDSSTMNNQLLRILIQRMDQHQEWESSTSMEKDLELTTLSLN